MKVKEIGGKITEIKESNIWFESLGGSRNRGFEKLGSHCVQLIVNEVLLGKVSAFRK